MSSCAQNDSNRSHLETSHSVTLFARARTLAHRIFTNWIVDVSTAVEFTLALNFPLLRCWRTLSFVVNQLVSRCSRVSVNVVPLTVMLVISSTDENLCQLLHQLMAVAIYLKVYYIVLQALPTAYLWCVRAPVEIKETNRKKNLRWVTIVHENRSVETKVEMNSNWNEIVHNFLFFRMNISCDSLWLSANIANERNEKQKRVDEQRCAKRGNKRKKKRRKMVESKRTFYSISNSPILIIRHFRVAQLNSKWNKNKPIAPLNWNILIRFKTIRRWQRVLVRVRNRDGMRSAWMMKCD